MNTPFASTNDYSSEQQTRASSMSHRLHALGFVEPSSQLEAIETFLWDLNLVGPDQAFVRASDELTKAALVYAVIEEDNYRQLTCDELLQHAAQVNGAPYNILSWIVRHFQAILDLHLSDSKDGLCRRDLLMTRNLCRGLEYAHRNFEKIAPDRTATKLTDLDILFYVWNCGHSLDDDSRRGLLQLASFLQSSGEVSSADHPKG
jgi:hypothetical protein